MPTRSMSTKTPLCLRMSRTAHSATNNTNTNNNTCGEPSSIDRSQLLILLIYMWIVTFQCNSIPYRASYYYPSHLVSAPLIIC